ncbi:isoprenylcysteine carboxylmethyltransferase family protein [Neobacillus drentensis]|uniref:isoprenylcysteine carboxyl methyltransferase family protein n=1 Tax=Neobacillus drentensis TaxID=220684 RepID=UPI002FFEF754
MIVMPFVLLIILIVIQRIVELFVAKRNEIWMKNQGAVEFGEKHYKFMVLIHMMFFISLFTETLLLKRGISALWPVFLCLFALAQVVRIWVITSLGKFWNTKVLVLPNARIVRKGPYRFLKHPNYVVVGMELLAAPMLFNAYFTAILFTVLNTIILMIRIPIEEKALITLTEYDKTFQDCHRFIPKFVKKL